MSSNQDWNQVVFNKSSRSQKGQQPGQGAAAQKTTRVLGPSNKQHHSRDPQNFRKIDQAEESKKIERVSQEVAQTIQRARNDKQWSQKELATKINEHHSVISDYETGQAYPNNQILSKLERVLGVKLRGKK